MYNTGCFRHAPPYIVIFYGNSLFAYKIYAHDRRDKQTIRYCQKIRKPSPAPVFLLK